MAAFHDWIFLSFSSLLLIGQRQPTLPRLGENTQSVAFARPTKLILMLVVLILLATLLNEVGIDWPVFMRYVFATPPFVNGFALEFVVFSQFIVWFFADDFVERYVPKKIM